MPTISLPQYQAVCRALRAERRHCEIARELDLSVWTIDRIASDLRQHGGPHAPSDDYQADLPEDDAPPDYVATRLRRCQGCGGMVYQWPCLTCELRKGRR